MRIKLPLQLLLFILCIYSSYSFYQLYRTPEISYYKNVFKHIIAFTPLVREYSNATTQVEVSSAITSIQNYRIIWQNLLSDFQKLQESQNFVLQNNLLELIQSILREIDNFSTDGLTLINYLDIRNRTEAVIVEQEKQISSLLLQMAVRQNKQSSEITALYNIKDNLYAISKTINSISQQSNIEDLYGLEEEIIEHKNIIDNIIGNTIEGNIEARIDRFRSARDRREMAYIQSRHQEFGTFLISFSAGYEQLISGIVSFQKLDRYAAQILQQPQLAETVDINQNAVLIPLVAIIFMLIGLIFVEAIESNKKTKKLRLENRKTRDSKKKFLIDVQPIIQNDLNTTLQSKGILKEPVETINLVVEKLRKVLLEVQFSNEQTSSRVLLLNSNIENLIQLGEYKLTDLNNFIRGSQEIDKSTNVLSKRLTEINTRVKGFEEAQKGFMQKSRSHEKLLTGLEFKMGSIFQGLDNLKRINNNLKTSINALLEMMNVVRSMALNSTLNSMRGTGTDGINSDSQNSFVEVNDSIQKISDNIINKSDLVQSDFANLDSLLSESIEAVRPELQKLKNERRGLTKNITQYSLSEYNLKNPFKSLIKVISHMRGIKSVNINILKGLHHLQSQSETGQKDLKSSSSYADEVLDQTLELKRVISEFTISLRNTEYSYSDVQGVADIFEDSVVEQEIEAGNLFPTIDLQTILQNEQKEFAHIEEKTKQEKIVDTEKTTEDIKKQIKSEAEIFESIVSHKSQQPSAKKPLTTYDFTNDEIEKSIDQQLAKTQDNQEKFQNFMEIIGGDDKTGYDSFNIEALAQDSITDKSPIVEQKLTAIDKRTKSLADQMIRLQKATNSDTSDSSTENAEPVTEAKPVASVTALENKKQQETQAPKKGMLGNFFNKYKQFPK